MITHKNNKAKNYITIIAGLIILLSGLFLLKTPDEILTSLKAFPYIIICLGCGIFGHGIGNMISNNALKNCPDILKELSVEQTDERNVIICNTAKAKAYDMMIFIFGSLLIALALMKIDITVVLIIAGAYLFITGYGIYYRIKFEKEM